MLPGGRSLQYHHIKEIHATFFSTDGCKKSKLSNHAYLFNAFEQWLKTCN